MQSSSLLYSYVYGQFLGDPSRSGKYLSVFLETEEIDGVVCSENCDSGAFNSYVSASLGGFHPSLPDGVFKTG